MDSLTKKSIVALICLLIFISLTTVAQNAPALPILPQSTNNILDNAFGVPDITVNSTLDTVDANPGDGICADTSNQCTLRAAIMESNAFPLTQTIHVPAGTYLLTIPGTDEDAAATGDLDITDTVLIYGDGQGQTIIDGNDLDRVFHIKLRPVSTDYRIEPILAQMTIQGGNAPYGGGIFNDGQSATGQFLTLRDNYAYGQSSCGIGAGAAAYSTDYLELNQSIITENRTPSISPDTTYGALAGNSKG
ncbi:MAG: CSLREA domain-containing protein, partial [Anaerolineae bacterium]|nr:CSLREA domain-containing protein [Anaerolineae bacterium]